MYATEFQTIINDPYVKIPEYESFKGKEVRIIVLNMDKRVNKIQEKQEDFIDYLINNPVDLPKDAKFLSREEAHER